MKREDLTGNVFGKLSVIEELGRDKKGYKTWRCKCGCGNECIRNTSDLKSRNVKSCGCLKDEQRKKKKLNKYKFEDDYVIGYASNNNLEFYIDKEDYELINGYTWYINSKGYVATRGKRDDEESDKYTMFLHRLIMNLEKTDNYHIEEVEHIDRNPLNNRKNNLMIKKHSENMLNKSKYKNNTSGITGVNWSKSKQKWTVRVYKDRKVAYFKEVKDFDEAVRLRLIAEKEIFGEHAGQRHLFDLYGIK